MIIYEYLAYTNMEAEVSQQGDTFLLVLRAQNSPDIKLVFNYLQVKVLVEGMLAVVGQAKINKFLDTCSCTFFGDMRVKLDIGQDEDEKSQETGEKTCRPNTLPARTKPNCRSKAV